MDESKSTKGRGHALSIDLTELPKIYILPIHLAKEDVVELQKKLSDAGATVTYDITEARLVLGAVSTARRAKFELQSRQLRTEQVLHSTDDNRLSVLKDDCGPSLPQSEDSKSPAIKRRKLIDGKEQDYFGPAKLNRKSSSTESETVDEYEAAAKTMSQLSMSHVSTEATASLCDPAESNDASMLPEVPEDHIKLLKLEWFTESVKAGIVKQYEDYQIYEGRILHAGGTQAINSDLSSSPTVFEEITLQSSKAKPNIALEQAFERAKADDSLIKPKQGKNDQIHSAMRRDFQGRSFASSTQYGGHKSGNGSSRPVQFLRETTSEHEEGISSLLPEMPLWVKENRIYACQRSTPLVTPNDDFIAQLKKIKLARLLTNDEIGVRAYSTSIASIAAYPHKLTSSNEIVALPGCDQKIAHLFYEWKTTGKISAVVDLDADPALSTLKLFYNIWGVGAKTARVFYYDKGWKDLDDIIEFGWHELSRVQQIGLKFYDEFELKISRSEVEFIASVVTYHAKQVIDEGIECVIVGGYRRGRDENGDVDLILSHREESATKNLITPVVNALETAGWITHTLTLHTTNSDRDQQPVAYKFEDDKSRGSGFDTLDKALVVWQDPVWPSRDADLAAKPDAKNPNPHRRVDIIIAPWRTVGCGVAGWTSGTTFQRDLRRYVKHVKGWKFDSSGVRERGTGRWIDLEQWVDPKTRAKNWQEAERRVFEGMDLEYRDPTERNTG